MNLRIIIIVLLIFTFISTVCICITRPDMHKSVLVYDSGYTITPQEVTTVEEIEMPVMTQAVEPEVEKISANEKIDNQIEQEKAQITYYTESKKSPNTTITKQTQNTKTQKQTKQKTTQIKQTQTPIQSTTQKTTISEPVRTVTTTQTTPISNSETTSQNVQKAPVGNTTVAVTKPVTTNTITTQAPQPKVLTAQEEEIAWNKWRSNLQNQIMKDSRMPNMPQGTVFKFSFTVDKYGKVTNVKTYSTNPAYTPYAIQYIAPAIRNYQGHSILNFPAGSNRVITDVSGSWMISTSAKYSTPQDFNDIEKVSR